jgi:transcriptional regulator with XRE-family HTH domain
VIIILQLKELRLKKNLDQKDVAEIVGITPQFYSYIEAGERRPSPEKAKKIAEILGFDWTLFYEERR